MKRQSPTLFAAVAALAVAVAVAAYLLLFSGGGGGTAAGAGVKIDLPSGWTSGESSANRLVVGPAAADLSWGTPARGPRLRIERAPGGLSQQQFFQAIISQKARDAASQAEIVEDPVAATVAGEKGIAIALSEPRSGARMVTRYVFVERRDASVYLFYLESPESAWQSTRATLETALASVRFVAP